MFAAVMGVAAASAQSRGALRINEVMVNNQNSAIDEYGNRNAWIELFNSAFAPLEISSVYITTDPDNPQMYPVPLGDVNTRIPKRQHVIFWADNEPSRGTFHTNFTLNPEKENWIGVYDANGITLIDSVTVPPLAPDQSFGRVSDGVRELLDENGVSIPAWRIYDNSSDDLYVTPSSNNLIRSENKKIEMFYAQDRHGFSLSIMAMCIVFGALLLLCLSFMLINKISTNIGRLNKMRSHGIDHKEIAREDMPDHDTGEEIAAITLALHEHLNAHDTESTVLTINKVKRAYSPWSSKIYSIRETPHKR